MVWGEAAERKRVLTALREGRLRGCKREDCREGGAGEKNLMEARGESTGPLRL